MGISIKELKKVISEELSMAEERIITRLSTQLENSLTEEKITSSIINVQEEGKKVDNGEGEELPDNENYKIALEMYKRGETHSSIAKKLDVSILSAKRYYNWLVNHGFLTSEKEELSPREKDIVELLYKRKMSLKEAADEIGCSVTNIVYFRNNALRKGFKPNE